MLTTFAQANREKERLEEKQRQERNSAEAAGKPWQPRWFEKVRIQSSLKSCVHMFILLLSEKGGPSDLPM